jgi:hypothetical protein
MKSTSKKFARSIARTPQEDADPLGFAAKLEEASRPAHPGRADVRPCRRRWAAPLRPGRADSVLCRDKFSTARGGGISVAQLPKRGRTWPPVAPLFRRVGPPDGNAIGSNPKPSRNANSPYPPNTRSIDHA